jgi:hypothetical protein
MAQDAEGRPRDHASKYTTCLLTHTARRALQKLRSPRRKRGEVGRIISELLVSEEARCEAWREVVQGSLYDVPGGRGKHKNPRDAA